MEIVEKIQSSVLVLAASGRFDSDGSRHFEDCGARAFSSEQAGFVIDLSEVDHINSAGLRTLLRAAKALKTAGKKIVLCGLHERVRTIFEITGFTTVFEIYDTRSAAIAAAS